MYYGCHRGLLVFSTKLEPILSSRLLKWSICREALLDFFTFEHVTDDRTLAQEVRLLAPTSVLYFERGETVVHSYVPEPLPTPTETRSAKAIARTFADELTASVDACTKESSSIALPLSGGLDSRAILGAALRIGKPIRAYTFGPPDCPDVVIAQQLSRKTSIPHVVQPIDGRYLHEWLDHGVYVSGGMMSCVHYHILALARTLAADGGVVLDGLGGDALTGGHLHWKMLLARHPRDAIEATYHNRATACATQMDLARLFDSEVLAQASRYDPKQAIRIHFEGLSRNRPWEGCHRFDLWERQRRFVQLGSHLLRPFSDVRAPFYGERVWSLLRALPARYLAEQRLYLRMHRKHFAELASIPDATRGLALSHSTAIRFAKHTLDFAKRRLSPSIPGSFSYSSNSPTAYATWWRSDLRDFLHDTLLANRPRYEALIRKEAVADLVQAHDKGSADHTTILGCLVTFEKFLRSLDRGSAPLSSSVISVSPRSQSQP